MLMIAEEQAQAIFDCIRVYAETNMADILKSDEPYLEWF
jgi:hypothetical protein